MAYVLAKSYRTYVATPEQYSTYRLRTLARELELDLSEIRLEATGNLGSLQACDVFVAMGNEVFPPIAGVGQHRLFVCQFPFPMHPNHVADAWGRLESFDRVAVYTEFAARHFMRRAHGLSPWIPPVSVLAPPVPRYEQASKDGRRKLGAILSVGRFTPVGHSKRQDLMIEAFRSLIAARSDSDLELHLVGTVSPDAESQAYFSRLRQAVGRLPVFFHLNASPEALGALYSACSLYWHATGYGQEETLFPERMEHFGISVVEAMSAGQIAIVCGVGGPAHTVTDGETGYHWLSKEHLVAQTITALDLNAADDRRIRAAAVHAASQYDMASFEINLESILEAMIRGETRRPPKSVIAGYA
jgi:glycosyltransferase involved in cell wall biosynthesis